ncbi:MAG TPA: hypothetical protein DEP51_01410 [Clostridiales bacterium]|nr:hypothetical protein [Clostridiales bacterium]
MSDTDKGFYPYKTIEQILGKPRDLSPEEIAEIAEKAEKATGRFRNLMREKANDGEKNKGCNQEFPPYQTLADVLEHENPETSGISQRFKVNPNVEEAGHEIYGE